ncbi:glycosyltransferase family 87 protein [Aquihabitans daechungensis]|uniref:glycosyltransferase family 87 protein n=1 Tax=Aquihabitans daechungensis TaxID=1052257 RepID=UPI003BA12DEC
MFFGYPPHVALLSAPLATLPFRVSWVLTTALMVAAALGALALLRPVLPILRVAWWPCVALSLTFVPLFVGVGLGQNTAVSLLLIAAAWRLFHDDRDAAAGVALGLLLFKPQLAIPLLVFVAAGGRWRAIGSAAVVGAATWVVNAAILGVGWVGTWLDGLSAFGDIDRASNAVNTISLLGVADTLADGATAAKGAAVVLDLALVAVVGLLWHRRNREDLTGAMAVAVPAAVLLAPHALYYDAGLIVLTGLVVLGRAPRSLPLVLAVWILGLAQVAASAIGLTPVGLAVVAALIGGWLVTGRSDAGTGEPVAVPVSSRS